MKKLMVLLILLLTGCIKEPLKVGFVNTLSGPYSSLGVDTMYGAELAVKKINDNGGVQGREIELIIKDDKADPTLAKQVDNELYDEGVRIIIGHGLSRVAESVIENANEKGYLLLSPTISTNVFSNIDDNFIRIIPGAETQGYELCNLVTKHGFKTITLLYEERNIAYTGPVKETFSECTNTNGITTYEHGYIGSDFDTYKASAELIKSENSDAVVFIGSTSDAINLEYNLKNLEVTTEVFLSTWGTTTDLLTLGSNQAGPVHGVNYYYLNSSNPNYMELAKEFENTYGKSISFSALFGYETVLVLANALERTESFNIEDVKVALVNRSYTGVMNDLFINSYGDSERKIYELILEEGKFVNND